MVFSTLSLDILSIIIIVITKFTSFIFKSLFEVLNGRRFDRQRYYYEAHASFHVWTSLLYEVFAS